MTSYNNATVMGAGQTFAITLSDGSIFNFTLTGTGTTGLAAIVPPSWSGSAVGNTAFLGIPNKPILYTTAGGTITLTMSGISITPPPGGTSSGLFMVVIADAESTNGGESLTYTTNGGNWTVIDQVNPISGSTYPTTSNTGTTYTETGVGGTVGAFIVGSQSPTTITAKLVAGGLQGIMFAIQYATISTTKVISGGRGNPADQFVYGAKTTSTGGVLLQRTTSGAGNGPFTAAVATVSSSVPTTVFEQMAAGSSSTLAQYTTNLNCTNGSAGSPTVLPSNQAVTSYNIASFEYGDAISCTFTNTPLPATVAIKKITLGAAGGPFTFTQTNLASNPANITTSSVGVATPASPTAIAVTALDTQVQITEASSLNYTLTSATCTDSQSALTSNPASFGSSTGFVVTIPATNIRPGAQITCTLTNTANTPTIRLQKALGGTGRLAASDQFSLSATGTGAPANVTTTGAGTAVTSAAMSFNATAGSSYTLNETMAAGSATALIRYQKSVSCTNSNSVGTNVSGISTVPINFTAALGDAISCVITNTPLPATVAIKKITTGAIGGPFSFTQTNLASNPANITTSTVGVAAPASPTAITVTTLGTQVQITEASTLNYTLTSTTCTDANSAVTSNPASFGSSSGFVVTIPATNIRSGAQITCTLTNAASVPTIRLQKALGGAGRLAASDQFRLSATGTGAPAAVTTTGAGTAVTSAAMSFNATAGSSYTLNETIAAGSANALNKYQPTVVCANSNSVGTNVSGITTIPINFTAALGDAINCVITNTPLPATVAIRKITTGAIGGPFSFTQTNLASNPANITTSTVGVAAPASPTAITVTTLSTQVQITEASALNFTLTSTTCSDANSAVTSNPASFGSSAGFVVTIPATNIRPGAQITCTLTNTANSPTISLQKALAGAGRVAASDQFRLSATGTGAPAAVTTTGTGTAVTSAAMSFNATAASSYVLNETMAAGSTSALTKYLQLVSCSNSNSVGTNVSGITAVPINFTAAQGDAISCVITNTPVIMNLGIVKTKSTAGPVSVGQTIVYTYTISNSGNVSMSNVQVTDMHGTPAAAVALGAGGITSEALTVPGPQGAGASPDGTANNGIWTTLAPGATITFTYTHTVTQVEIDRG